MRQGRTGGGGCSPVRPERTLERLCALVRPRRPRGAIRVGLAGPNDAVEAVWRSTGPDPVAARGQISTTGHGLGNNTFRLIHERGGIYPYWGTLWDTLSIPYPIPYRKGIP